MCGKTKRKQVPLYLDHDRVELLSSLAAKLGRTQQELLREALDAKLRRHRVLEPRKPRSP